MLRASAPVEETTAAQQRQGWKTQNGGIVPFDRIEHGDATRFGRQISLEELIAEVPHNETRLGDVAPDTGIKPRSPTYAYVRAAPAAARPPRRHQRACRTRRRAYQDLVGTDHQRLRLPPRDRHRFEVGEPQRRILDTHPFGRSIRRDADALARISRRTGCRGIKTWPQRPCAGARATRP